MICFDYFMERPKPSDKLINFLIAIFTAFLILHKTSETIRIISSIVMLKAVRFQPLNYTKAA